MAAAASTGTTPTATIWKSSPGLTAAAAEAGHRPPGGWAPDRRQRSANDKPNGGLTRPDLHRHVEADRPAPDQQRDAAAGLGLAHQAIELVQAGETLVADGHD